jgi:hypothetical protein
VFSTRWRAPLENADLGVPPSDLTIDLFDNKPAFTLAQAAPGAREWRSVESHYMRPCHSQQVAAATDEESALR